MIWKEGFNGNVTRRIAFVQHFYGDWIAKIVYCFVVLILQLRHNKKINAKDTSDINYFKLLEKQIEKALD